MENKEPLDLTVYLKERDEMLEKFDIEELNQFIYKYCTYFEYDITREWMRLRKQGKFLRDYNMWLTLCDMILHNNNVSKETKSKARKKLKTLKPRRK